MKKIYEDKVINGCLIGTEEFKNMKLEIYNVLKPYFAKYLKIGYSPIQIMFLINSSALNLTLTKQMQGEKNEENSL